MPTFSQEQRLAIAIGVPTLALLFFLWYRNRQSDESFDDDEEEEVQDQVVATVFETTIEVQIPQYLVGTVIGRGGANIKQIQKDSGAYIRFKDDENEPKEEAVFQEAKPETDMTRTVVIKGERERARKAEFLIKKIISEQPKIFTEEYYIPQKSCGRIIGRGGLTIRHLSKVSGAKMTICRDDMGPEVPRKCTLVGTVDQIANAKGLLDEKIAEHQQAMSRGHTNQTSRFNRKDTQHTVIRPKPSQVPTFPFTNQYPDTSEYVEVFVSSVDNPGHFYVQLVRTDDAQKLEELTDTLTNEAASSGTEDIIDSIEVGTYCSASFTQDESRYRAKVTQINDDGTVSLYYVDYGDYGTSPKYKLRKLREEYLQLSFQAIECYLANTKPKGDDWDDNAMDDFENLTHYPNWVGLMARVVKYCGDVPCLELYDTSTEQDIFINQEMVNRGYAVEDGSFPPQPSKPEPNTSDDQGIAKSQTKPEAEPLAESEIFTVSSPPVDEVDTNKEPDLIAPINPKEFSPIKSALVKRVSKDYIETSKVATGNQAAVETISEEKINQEPVQEPIIAVDAESSQAQSAPEVDFMTEVTSTQKVASVTEVKEPVIAADVESQAESAPEVDFVTEVKPSPPQDEDFITEVKAEPEVESSPTDTTRSGVEGSGFSSPNSSLILKPEVREMIELEVGQAFETQLVPSNGIVTHSPIQEEHDEKEPSSENVTQSDSGIELRNDEVKHVESTLKVDVDSRREPTVTQSFVTPTMDTKGDDEEEDDDDDDLETFTSTLQRQVQSKKTFVSSVTVPSNQTKRSTVTIVPTDDKEDGVTESQPSKRSYADAAKKSQDGATKTGLLTGSDVAEHVGSHGDNVVVDIQSKSDENTVFELHQQEMASATTPDTDGTMTTVDHVIETSNEKAPIPNSKNSSMVMEKEEISKPDRKSPVNFDSDSESYLSALEEPASDTDSMSYYDTAADHISSSTTSLDYLTPGVDTDTDTLKPHGEEVGTPVNSDTDDDDDDDYDSDDEDESEAGNKTPKRKDSSEVDDEEDLASTPKAEDSAKMAARYLSDMDLGYKGDTEDVTESREDLR